MTSTILKGFREPVLASAPASFDWRTPLGAVPPGSPLEKLFQEAEDAETDREAAQASAAIDGAMKEIFFGPFLEWQSRRDQETLARMLREGTPPIGTNLGQIKYPGADLQLSTEARLLLAAAEDLLEADASVYFKGRERLDPELHRQLRHFRHLTHCVPDFTAVADDGRRLRIDLLWIQIQRARRARRLALLLDYDRPEECSSFDRTVIELGSLGYHTMRLSARQVARCPHASIADVVTKGHLWPGLFDRMLLAQADPRIERAMRGEDPGDLDYEYSWPDTNAELSSD